MSFYDSDTKIWSGPGDDRIIDGGLSLREVILSKLRSTPEKVFQISDDEGTVLTCAQIELMSIRVAQNLKLFGVNPGDVITYFVKSSSVVAPIVFGCCLLGAPINPLKCTTVEFITAMFQVNQPKIIIIDDGFESIELLMKIAESVGLGSSKFFVDDDKKLSHANMVHLSELLKETSQEKNFTLSQTDKITDESPVFIVPSSGTTGFPKSIALSGKYMKYCQTIWNIRDDVVMFSYSCINWVSGIISLMFILQANGVRVITNESFSPKGLGQIVRKHKVTTTLTSSEAVIAMFNSPDFDSTEFVSIKEYICGGERISKAVRDFMRSKLPAKCFGAVYGTTECGIMTTNDRDSDISEVEDNVVGFPRSYVKMKIVDIASREALGVNEQGELLVRTPMSFSEYYNNAEATSKAFEGKGWCKTGDIGYFDEFGLLHVYGRIIDMVTVKGKKIHPAHIESVIETIEGVKAACAVNTSDDVIAVLCLKSPESALTEEELTLQASIAMPNIEFGGGFHFVDAIPRVITNTPKIYRVAARNLAIELMNAKNIK